MSYFTSTSSSIKIKNLAPCDHWSFFHLELQAMGLLLTSESLFSSLLEMSNNVYGNASFLDGKIDHPMFLKVWYSQDKVTVGLFHLEVIT